MLALACRIGNGIAAVVICCGEKGSRARNPSSQTVFAT